MSKQDLDEHEVSTIAQASDLDVREYLRRRIMERRLSKVMHTLNVLEQRPPTREMARRALKRLGFPTAPSP